MSKKSPRPLDGLRAVVCVTLFISLTVGEVLGQAPPAPSPAQRAVDERKAIFTLIGSNFRPLGQELQRRTSLDGNERRKRAERLAFLTALASDAFSDVSNVGDPGTRARPEIWSHRADFDKALADFSKHSQALARIVAQQSADGEALKSAVGAVAQDCKSCHDHFRSK